MHGDGFHFDPSFSSLKCVLVMNGSCRYFGSSTTVRTSRITSPFGSGPTLSKYSVMFAFATGLAWHLLCPYDTSELDETVIAEARRSHEFVREAGQAAKSGSYRGLDESAAPLDSPFGDPPSGARKVSFDRDRLLDVRREVMRFATAAGLDTGGATRLVTAVNEVATNSVVHGGGGGTLRIWRAGETVVSEVRDSGSYRHALADRVRPTAASKDARGLWLANQLCDLVQIRTLSDATLVRLHVKGAAGAN